MVGKWAGRRISLWNKSHSLFMLEVSWRNIFKSNGAKWQQSERRKLIDSKISAWEHEVRNWMNEKRLEAREKDGWVMIKSCEEIIGSSLCIINESRENCGISRLETKINSMNDQNWWMKSFFRGLLLDWRFKDCRKHLLNNCISKQFSVSSKTFQKVTRLPSMPR